MITRIVCSGCGDVLRIGAINAPTENKVCPRCVAKSYPRANPNEIKLPPGLKELSQSIRKEEPREEPKIELKAFFVEENNGEIIWLLSIERDKKVAVEFGFTQEQLETTLAEMKTIKDKKLLEPPK